MLRFFGLLRIGAVAVALAAATAALSACAPDPDFKGHDYTSAWGGYHH